MTTEIPLGTLGDYSVKGFWQILPQGIMWKDLWCSSSTIAKTHQQVEVCIPSISTNASISLL